jgi:hypothetical protein
VKGEGRGRPKKRWKDRMNQDLCEKNSSRHEVDIFNAFSISSAIKLKRIRKVI